MESRTVEYFKTQILILSVITVKKNNAYNGNVNNPKIQSAIARLEINILVTVRRLRNLYMEIWTKMFSIIVTGVNTRLIQNKILSVCTSFLAYLLLDKNTLLFCIQHGRHVQYRIISNCTRILFHIRNNFNYFHKKLESSKTFCTRDKVTM